MKKVITLVIVALFSTATFAQGSKMDSKAATPAKSGHECYSMKDGKLMHCTGDKQTPQTSAVTLKNGTMISPDGTMKAKDGKSSKLEAGMCVEPSGNMGDCDKMHAALKKGTAPDQKPMTK